MEHRSTFIVEVAVAARVQSLVPPKATTGGACGNAFSLGVPFCLMCL